MQTQRVEVAEITKMVIYSLVLAAVSMSAAPGLVRASSRIELEEIRSERSEEVDEEYFQVEFYDRSGNVLDVKVNPQDGSVVSVEETTV